MEGKTISVPLHSYAFGLEMFARLRTRCDRYFDLTSEQVLEKSVRRCEVNRINTKELSRDNTGSFVVEPHIGMRVIHSTNSELVLNTRKAL